MSRRCRYGSRVRCREFNGFYHYKNAQRFQRSFHLEHPKFRIAGYNAVDLNGERHTGFSIAQTTNRNGSRLSVARAFLRPARDRANLHVMLNATVTRVLINQTTRQAYAVEVRNSYGGTEVIFANNEIIVR